MPGVNFTPETAKAASLKAAEHRRAYAEIAQGMPYATPELYAVRRLVRVRKQLDLVDRMTLTAKTLDELDAATRASLRLHTQEMELSGRPKPGQFRPNAPTRARRAVTVEPIEMLPAPESVKTPDTQPAPVSTPLTAAPAADPNP